MCDQLWGNGVSAIRHPQRSVRGRKGDCNLHLFGEGVFNQVVGDAIEHFAGQLVRGSGFGIVGDIIIGIVGSLLGTWLLPQLGVRIGSGLVSAIVSATIGAVLLLLILRIVRRGRRW